MTTVACGCTIAVVGAIIVSRAIDLGAHGVVVLGPVPTGLPRLGLTRIMLQRRSWANRDSPL
jgi:hypothetical protein